MFFLPGKQVAVACDAPIKLGGAIRALCSADDQGKHALLSNFKEMDNNGTYSSGPIELQLGSVIVVKWH
jgi:hypothetical protein